MDDDQDNAGGKVTVTLTKPVNAHGEEVSALTFREPTGADIVACGGNPVLLDMGVDPPKIDFDAKRMADMLSRLGNVPASTVRALNGRDFTTCCWSVSGFFLPG